MDTNNEFKTEKAKLAAMATLRNSYAMYERSRADMIDKRQTMTDKHGNRIYSDESIAEQTELINTMQDDIVKKYIELGGTLDDLRNYKAKNLATKKDRLLSAQRAEKKDELVESEKKNGTISYFNYDDYIKKDTKHAEETKKKTEKRRYSSKLLEESTTEKKKQVMEEKPVVNEPKRANFEPKDIDFEPKTETENLKVTQSDGKTAYDTVNLPSKGECYKNKMKEIEVSYLTAYDENLILSPNLYKNGTFLDHILKNKVLSNVDPDDLIQGDRDAIIIWLRASGYGDEYPVEVEDTTTGKQFRTTIKLSSLKYKKFNLKGDENGFFDFTMPVCGDEVKFRFLTNRDTKKLQEMHDDEDKEIKANIVRNNIAQLRLLLENEDLFSEEQAESIADALDTIEEESADLLRDAPQTDYVHDLTNRLILSTVSINGNTDRKYIAEYILNLNVKDANAYRDYIFKNEPGIDYNIKVERPGGGEIETFLRLDQFIFITKV